MKIIIRVGGSVVASPFNSTLIGQYINLLKSLKQQGLDIIAVIGGGSLARDFIKVAKDLGLKEKQKDWVAIHVSRLFARLFTFGLGERGCGNILTSIDKVGECLENGKIAVLGGLYPGMTTDSVAALIGEREKADLLIKCSNVDGIYDKDPRKFSNAKKMDVLKFKDLRTMFETSNHKAGINQIIDPEAVKILHRCRLKTIVVNGFVVENVLAAIKGNTIGTAII